MPGQPLPDTVQLAHPCCSDERRLPPAGVVHRVAVDMPPHSLLLEHAPQQLTNLGIRGPVRLSFDNAETLAILTMSLFPNETASDRAVWPLRVKSDNILEMLDRSIPERKT